MFCKKLSKRKDRKFLNLASWDRRDTIYVAAEAKGDTDFCLL